MFAGMYDYCSLYAGGSIDAAVKLNNAEVRQCILYVAHLNLLIVTCLSVISRSTGREACTTQDEMKHPASATLMILYWPFWSS